MCNNLIINIEIRDKDNWILIIGITDKVGSTAREGGGAHLPEMATVAYGCLSIFSFSPEYSELNIINYWIPEAGEV